MVLDNVVRLVWHKERLGPGYRYETSKTVSNTGLGSI